MSDINEARARLQRLADGGFVQQVYGISGKLDFRTDLATVLAQPVGAAAGWSETTFKCAAMSQGTTGGNDPADCDWPVCSCERK